RRVHPARNETLDQQAAADEAPHETADGRQLAQRHQRPEIAEFELGQRPSCKTRLHALHQEQGLLARGLRPWWYQRSIFSRPSPWTRGAVAESEDIRVSRCLHRRLDHELIGAIDLQSVELREKCRRLDACRPDD